MHEKASTSECSCGCVPVWPAWRRGYCTRGRRWGLPPVPGCTTQAPANIMWVCTRNIRNKVHVGMNNDEDRKVNIHVTQIDLVKLPQQVVARAHVHEGVNAQLRLHSGHLITEDISHIVSKTSSEGTTGHRTGLKRAYWTRQSSITRARVNGTRIARHKRQGR